MAQADAQVIIPRRNFLIRALGFTASGAAMALPVVTLGDPNARLSHHMKGLLAALSETYPGTQFEGHYRFPDGEEGEMGLMSDSIVVVVKTKARAVPETRAVVSDWRTPEYEALRADWRARR